MEPKKIVFLSNNSIASIRAYNILKYIKDIEIIGINQGNSKFTNFPSQYDLGIGFLYPFRIPEEQLYRAKWWNFHPAPLPEYPGRNVAYRAIMNEAKEFGATLHYMNRDFDAGPIIETIRFPITEVDNAESILRKSQEKLLKLLQTYIQLYITNKDIIGYANTTQYLPTITINDFIQISKIQQKRIRALTCNPHYAKIDINGKIYQVIPC